MLLSLSLNDAELVLAARGADAEITILSEAPGFAVLEEQRTLTGNEAARRVRLKPLLAHTNFWRALSTDALTRPSRLARTTADLAFAQIEALLEPHKQNAEGMLLAVPPGYSREQLGLLLGIVGESAVPVVGMVDAALSACSLEPSPVRVLHLELELHQALLTVLEYTGGERAGLKRSRYEFSNRHGLLGLQQSWLQFIAENFVLKTRFDPLHDAGTEQLLVDQLPHWLHELSEKETLTLSVDFRGQTLDIELTRAQFIAAVEPHYAELLRLVQGARVAGAPIALRVSAQLAALPGLLERFSSLRDCETRVVPKGAAAIGALRHEANIRRPPESLALVYQLPTPRDDTQLPAATELESTPAQVRPTHVLFQGRAWSISEQPLIIGWAAAVNQRALLLPSASPGVSRSHCTLIRRNGAVVIEDHSTYGSFVNEERVVGRTVLTVGDRLRLGSPGVALDLIQLVNDDGAP